MFGEAQECINRCEGHDFAICRVLGRLSSVVKWGLWFTLRAVYINIHIYTIYWCTPYGFQGIGFAILIDATRAVGGFPLGPLWLLCCHGRTLHGRPSFIMRGLGERIGKGSWLDLFTWMFLKPYTIPKILPEMAGISHQNMVGLFISLPTLQSEIRMSCTRSLNSLVPNPETLGGCVQFPPSWSVDQAIPSFPASYIGFCTDLYCIFCVIFLNNRRIWLFALSFRRRYDDKSRALELCGLRHQAHGIIGDDATGDPSVEMSIPYAPCMECLPTFIP